jgi:predicted metal-dependent phosphoesterase TrpH
LLKTELHAHTADDPVDVIPHTVGDLIDAAADQGYRALAITLHDRQFDIREAAAHARDRGVTLISGIERTIHGRHVLLLNFPHAEQVVTFEDVRRLRARHPNGLVIAPHPFFPAPSCLLNRMNQYSDLFDAVEWNAFYTRQINFNRRAERWATDHGKPLVGNGDVHRLSQLGTTFSLVDAEPDPDAICAAIREGRVRIETQPIGTARAATLLGSLFAASVRRPFHSGRGVRRVSPAPAAEI